MRPLQLFQILSPKSLLFFYRRKIEPGLRIEKDWLVVDIGSGDKPFWRGDVFVDMMSLGNNQRASNLSTETKLGFFLDQDITKKTVFKKKVFDFCFCSHLLEHVEDPAAAINEITRIAKRGYLEVPNAIAECVRPYHSHLWFIFLYNDTIIFRRKSKQDDMLFRNNSESIKKFNLDNPFIRFYWKGKIKFKVIDDLKIKERFVPITHQHSDHVQMSRNYYLLLVKVIRTFFYTNKNSLSQQLIEK